MASTSKFQAIKLTEDDVPGAKLIYPEVENHSVVQLRRWLLCRGVKTSGNKCDLVQRVKDCISSGNTDISVSVDAGKWMDMKASDLKASTSDDASSSNPKIPPVVGWKVFPSTNLPQYFNEGHIHHYIIESVQLLDQPGNDSGEDEIDDLHTSKPLKKGKQYFKSGHVCNLKDFKSGNVYFLKASVMASYRIKTSYNVTVTMSAETGFVQDASCTCIASSMGRCSHVAAVLFALLDYCQQYGHELAACTSKKCEWNVGRKKRKNPQKITESKYSGIKQKKIDELISYDPRPPTYQTDDNPDLEENTFRQELQYQNCFSSMWATLLKYNYEDYDIDDMHEEELRIKRKLLLENLSLSLDTDPTEIISSQRCDEWNCHRRVRITASKSKTVATLKSDSAIRNTLSNIMYPSTSYQTRAMLYGIEKESLAFSHYTSSKKDATPSFEACTTGFWVSLKNPELGCSPDGLVTDPIEQNGDIHGLVEIKCPYILKDTDIETFDSFLSGSQKSNFFLVKKKSGTIALKRNHDYYFQVQMQLGIMGRNWCDFYVWSSKGSFCERIRFDKTFWESLAQKLVKFHHTRLCPEYFEFRIPRRLEPIDISE